MHMHHRETERPQLAGDREQDIPDWLQPLTEGLVEGTCGSSGSAGETIPKIPSSSFQRDFRTNVDGHTIYLIISRWTPMVIYAHTQKSRELHAEEILKIEKTGYHERPTLVTHLLRTTKFKRDEKSRLHRRYAAVVQDLASQWMQSHPCENKTAHETMRSLHRFLLPESKPGVLYTDNSLSEFKKACKDLAWNHDKSTRQVDPTSIRNSWNRRKSGQNRKSIDFDVVVIHETFKTFQQMGKLFTKVDTTLHSVV